MLITTLQVVQIPSFSSFILTTIIICMHLNRYASAFYGPFREALDSNPRFGDKKTYVTN